MSLYDLRQIFPGSNGRAAMANAIRGTFDDGEQILQAEFAASQRLRMLRAKAASAVEIRNAEFDWKAARARRVEAENKIRAQFEMRLI